MPAIPEKRRTFAPKRICSCCGAIVPVRTRLLSVLKERGLTRLEAIALIPDYAPRYVEKALHELVRDGLISSAFNGSAPGIYRLERKTS
jgi:hypothetical protein